jgi:peptide/nickel transport system ATP-binding protein
MKERPLLTVEDLHVSYQGRSGHVLALRGVSFEVHRERLGIVGESGSGKSTIGLSILRLLPGNARVSARRLDLEGIEILRASERTMRSIRGRRISMILQDPKFSLNPVLTVGQQIAESYRVHTHAAKAEANRKALGMLEAVRIRDPERVFSLYPHEVSGGMGQRVMIAMMLIPEPELLIADEPTSALDVTVQAQLLELIDELIQRRRMGLILISHNMNLVASFCDRILVLYGGQVMEMLNAADVSAAQHPYTQGLLACRPLIERPQFELPQLKRDPTWLGVPSEIGVAARDRSL